MLYSTPLFGLCRYLNNLYNSAKVVILVLVIYFFNKFLNNLILIKQTSLCYFSLLQNVMLPAVGWC